MAGDLHAIPLLLAEWQGLAPTERSATMRAVYAESFSTEDPLAGLVVGDRPVP